ncbi:SMP-30/gluconolactonase/LRE family protein [Herbihabitans rhizosphaerae]|nr:hypothetical protein [Herbihabitans rhizosphaerae]
MFAIVAVLAAVGLSPAQAAATPLLTQPRCAGPAPSVDVFKAGGLPLADWRENLEFDGRGRLWVSHINNSQVEGYDASGRLVATIPVPSPGGIRRGVDGLMYVNFGIGPADALTGKPSGLMRFDSTLDRPTASVFATLPGGINGLAVDGAGNFYFGREFAPSVLKVRQDGSIDQAWTDAAGVFGTNGVTVLGSELYATVLVHPSSPVARVPLADPGAHATVADLSPLPVLPKGLDDLEARGDALYVTAFVSGELLRVDRATGRTCVLVSGLITPTSVRVPVGFGDADPARELFVTEASGRIVRVRT